MHHSIFFSTFTWRIILLTLVYSTSAAQTTSSQPGSHTDIPRWCGKAYQQGSPNFEPGGRFAFPNPSPSLRLDIQLVTRHTLYDSSEQTATFILDTTLSHLRGQTLHQHDSAITESTTNDWTFVFEIHEETARKPLTTGSTRVNSTDNLIEIDLKPLKPRLQPYQIRLSGNLTRSHSSPSIDFNPSSYAASTELFYLPAKHSGSTVKVDRLNGGLFVANHVSNYSFRPLLPFGFYASCSAYLNVSRTNIVDYAAKGFNAVNPVCAFTDGNLTDMFDRLDEANIWYQYDMRGTYMNATSVAAQVPLLQNRSNLLTWYTADEPDGWQYPLDSTRKAYDQLRHLDPYHPTALVLNCRDYYFQEYSSGADIIMEDAYPIAINATYSRRWHTPVNRTYGDSGCDDCKGNVLDVRDRLDTLSQFGASLASTDQRKPLWSVLQAFSGEEYWSRDPTPQETHAMALLAWNHGARGMLSWLYPTPPPLTAAYSSLAKLMTSYPISSLLLGSRPTRIDVANVTSVDVAYWRLGDEFLVGVANLNLENDKSPLLILLPFNNVEIVSVPWGDLHWTLQNDALYSNWAPRLATSFVILRRSTPARTELRIR